MLSRILLGFGFAIALSPISFGQSGLTPPGTFVNTGQWKIYAIKPTDFQGKLTSLLTIRHGSMDLYVRKGAPPTLAAYDYKAVSSNVSESISITNTSSVPLTSDFWYVGVYGVKKGFFDISNQTSRIVSEFTGNGAVPFARGTTFRTFAPFATQLNVTGDFNGWSATAAQMVSEGNGWWSIDYRNVAHGNQYKFVLKNGTTFWKNDPWARQMTNSVGNSVVYDQNHYSWQTQNFVSPSWNKAVIYELHLGSFNPTSPTVAGTLARAELKLDYLKDLGINMIELMPVQEFPGDFSWGYNPSAMWTVESAYGGPEALKHFVDQANSRGIGVMLDMVHNHYGPNDMDMWRFDGWSQGIYGGIFFYNDDRAITSWSNTRPDFGRAEVRSFIRDNAMMWLQDYRISGFRWDSTLTMRTTNRGDNPDGWSLMQWINDSKNSTQPWKLNVAEDLQNNDWLTKPTSQGGAGFDSQWSNFVHTIRGTMTATDDNNRDMNAVASILNERFNGDAFHRVIYSENHDENANGHQRLPVEIDGTNNFSYWAQKRSTLAAAAVLTAPGIPMLFQGQEFLENGWFDANRPLDWAKATTYSGIKQLYKDLVSLRTNLAGKSAGLSGQGMNLFHANNSSKVIAFHRYDQGGSNDDVVCVFNFKNTTYNNYTIGLPRSGGWSVAFNSDWSGYSTLFGNLFCPNITAIPGPYDGLNYKGTVNLAPYSCVILTKD